MSLKEAVQAKYAGAARRVASGEGFPADCCTSTSCCAGSAASSCDPISSGLYTEGQKCDLPDLAVKASLGCGNPTALAELNPGETVLDLGSGGGIDVLLSARRVGPEGLVYGIDMTDEMLALANANKREAGLENVQFLKGEMENLPLPDGAVDVVISNCVINLAADKDRVLKEAFRVLRPGGRFAVSDVVVRGNLPVDVRKNMELWVGCIAGALEENEYREKLACAGFEAIGMEVTRSYREEFALAVEGDLVSAFVRARKPRAGAPV